MHIYHFSTLSECRAAHQPIVLLSSFYATFSLVHLSAIVLLYVDVSIGTHLVYIFSSSLFERFGSERVVATVLAFFRSRVCIRNVNVSLKPTESASPRISIFPPAATSSTDLRALFKSSATWVTRISDEHSGTPNHLLDEWAAILPEAQ